MIKTYEELLQFNTFDDRFNYLRLNGNVGEFTFADERYLNQVFYKSYRWRRIRDEVIIRDNGCEFGLPGYEIGDASLVRVHHMNPLTVEDIEKETEFLINPRYLITVSLDTHLALHYSNRDLLLINPIIERRPNDTTPWK